MLRSRTTAVSGFLIFAVIAVAVLLWAKWLPYQARAVELGGSHEWTGSGILGVGGVEPGDPPSWSAATSFTGAYTKAVWKALVAALLISVAVQALVPRAWLLRVLSRRSRVGSAMAGGLAATPSMMCACCSAPVAVTLRRTGVPVSAVVAYWLGNPLLNPAVLIFLFLVAPWQWGATRLLVGALVVIAGAALVDRFVPGTATPPPPPEGRRGWLPLLLIVPEYLVVVMLVGAFRGWLFPLSAASAGVLAVLAAAVVGTAMVIPTAGEIPIVQGLALAGLSLGAAGALLITLPAVSIPGAVLVVRTLGWKVTAATAGVVVAGGLAGGAVLALLTP